MQTIDLATLQLPVAGVNLAAGALCHQLRSDGSLLVFLRHLSCAFCKEMVADLKKAADAGPFPPIVMVSQSPCDETAEFFEKHWPGSRVIADPDRVLHKAFAITRATFGGVFGPMLWPCLVRAAGKGHTQKLGHTLSPPHGDPWLLSAMFLARSGGQVDWFHRARFAGDRPDYASIPRPGANGIPAAVLSA